MQETWETQIRSLGPEDLRLYCSLLSTQRASQWIKNPPAMQETQVMRVQYLGWEDPLEKGRATQSGIFAWRTPWTEEPVGLKSTWSQRAGHNWSSWAQYEHAVIALWLKNNLHTVIKIYFIAKKAKTKQYCQRSLITSPWKYDNDEKVCDIVRITKTYHRDWSRYFWKNGTKRLAQCR